MALQMLMLMFDVCVYGKAAMGNQLKATQASFQTLIRFSQGPLVVGPQGRLWAPYTDDNDDDDNGDDEDVKMKMMRMRRMIGMASLIELGGNTGAVADTPSPPDWRISTACKHNTSNIPKYLREYICQTCNTYFPDMYMSNIFEHSHKTF